MMLMSLSGCLRICGGGVVLSQDSRYKVEGEESLRCMTTVLREPWGQEDMGRHLEAHPCLSSIN